MPIPVEIKILVTPEGNANVALGGIPPLQASLILSQVCVQLQANALQQAGGTIIARPPMPGLRLS